LRVATNATATVNGSEFDECYRVAWPLIAIVGVHLNVDDVRVFIAVMLHHVIVHFGGHSVIFSMFW
jgi:hypothetical protein